MTHYLRIAASLALILSLTSCRSLKYAALEGIGVEKRNILTDNVGDMRKATAVAQDVFKSALDRYMDVVDVKGGDLEKKYGKLNKELEKSEKRARAVNDRIRDVEVVAKDLFKEWQKELKQYESRELRNASAQKLQQSQRHYQDMIKSMKQVAGQMDPVLKVFRDQVLFLKHNLNSQAIAGLDNEKQRVEAQVTALVAGMERSIAEADAFINKMGLMQ